MIDIAIAHPDDIEAVVDLERRLFAEDAGTYERFADVGWPAREGRADFTELISDPHGTVLLAHENRIAVGLLMGYSNVAGSTRQPVRYAVLRTMYVAETHRRRGVARRLTERFVDWARGVGCVEVQVNHYAGNSNAGSLYEQCGFQVHSINRVLAID